MSTSGIYCILNTCNSKRYIGQTVNLAHRRYYHFSALRHGSHPNLHLQAAFNRYGPHAFRWSVLQVLAGTHAIDAAERRWIALYASNDPNHGYNAEPGGLTRPRASCATLRRMQKAQSRRRAMPMRDVRDSAANLRHICVF